MVGFSNNPKTQETLKWIRENMKPYRGLREGGSFIRDFANGINKISPAQIFENKHVRHAGAKTGQITNENLLPAVVDIGKPVYDTTASMLDPMTAGQSSKFADQLWRERAEPYRPQQRSSSLKTVTNKVSPFVNKRYKNGMKY